MWSGESEIEADGYKPPIGFSGGDRTERNKVLSPDGSSRSKVSRIIYTLTTGERHTGYTRGAVKPPDPDSIRKDKVLAQLFRTASKC